MSAEHHQPSNPDARPQGSVIPLTEYERWQKRQQARKPVRAAIIAASIALATVSGVGIVNRLLSSEAAVNESVLPEEIVQEGIKIIEDTVTLNPGVNIRTSTSVVASGENKFNPHPRYRDQILVVTNPEVVTGASATGSSWRKEPWLSFELEDWLGKKQRVYVNIGPMTRDFIESTGKESITVNRVKQGKTEFYKTSDDQRLPIASVSIQPKEASRRPKRSLKPHNSMSYKAKEIRWLAKTRSSFNAH